MITIIAILAAIAYPSYDQSVKKARRADAQTSLMTFANSAERIFNEYNAYDADEMNALKDDMNDPDKSSTTDYYTFEFEVLSDTSYRIKATPNPNPPVYQDRDPCGSMTLSSTGQKTHTGTSLDCWFVGRS